MTPKHSLPALDVAFSRRLLRLQALANDAQTLADEHKRRHGSYIAIELYNAWAGFARCAYLSIMCGARTASGVLARPASGTLATHDAALEAAIRFVQTNPNNHKEPHWFDPATFTRLAQHFSVTNLASVTSAFGYPTAFFKLAPTFRNFHAHKNEGTATKVERIRLALFPGGPHCPSRLMIDVIRPTSPSLAIEWIHDVRSISTLFVQ